MSVLAHEREEYDEQPLDEPSVAPKSAVGDIQLPTINLSLVPAEMLLGVLKSAFEFGTGLTKLARSHRETMDQALRNREDVLRVKGLERIDEVFDVLWNAIKKIGAKP